jgi:hypothetical protein
MAKRNVKNHEEECCQPHHVGKNLCKGGDVYGVGLVGAVIYFIQHATTFWGGVLGVLKAMIWPAFVVYKLLEFLKL